MLIPHFSCFFNIFEFTIAHILLNGCDSTLVTANIILVCWLERNFSLDEGAIVLFDNIPDGINLFYLNRLDDVIAIPVISFHIFATSCISILNTTFDIANDSLKS